MHAPNDPLSIRTSRLLLFVKRLPLRPSFVLGALAIAYFAFSPSARAVTPAPDRGYPGNNTAEGTQALFIRTTGSNNTALGFQPLFHTTTSNFNTATGFQA